MIETIDLASMGSAVGSVIFFGTAACVVALVAYGLYRSLKRRW